MPELWKAVRLLGTAAKLRIAEKLASGGDVVFRTIFLLMLSMRALGWITSEQAFVLFVIGVSFGVGAWLANRQMRTAAHI